MEDVNHPGHEHPASAVVTRPPFLFLGGLIVAHILDHLMPSPLAVLDVLPLARDQDHVLRHSVSGALILLGMIIFVAGIRNFTRAGTPVPSTQPASALVTTGIHGRSRNPIYVGMFLIYAGIGITLRSEWIFLFLLPIAIVMRYAVVAREEAYLERRFGERYRAYKARVRRWL